MSNVYSKEIQTTQYETALPSATGMIIRQKEPVNLESPFDKLDSFVTPSDLFYVRSHFKAPELTTRSYRLRMHGAVENTLNLDYQQLRDLPSETRMATLECAGNGRVFLVPQAEGAQWELGAVGNASWTGVPLRVLLEQAGLSRKAHEIVFQGADRGTPKEQPIPPGPISYARSLPLATAVRPDVLVVYEMNGRELSQDHGYPVRLVVPGHYGMASVKWLTAIQVLEEPFQGYWQTIDYGYWDYIDGIPVRRPLSEMALKSQIARPSIYEVIPAGSVYIVTGAAWSGKTDVSEVELSTDGGQHWRAVELVDPAQQYAWRRWQFAWNVPLASGRYTLMVRARGANGAVQPKAHDPSHGSYVINHTLPIDVIVR
jgi:DMSO/TMAO reductase YedYZ molybdopterin-dependent catalytic subunit